MEGRRSMSRSAILSATIENQLKIADIETAEEAGAVLTLTRTAVQAITTAGTIITWQSEIRSYQITWATDTITIPSTGWYAISLSVTMSINLNSMLAVLRVNAVNAVSTNFFGDVDRNINSVTFIRHFTENDALQISLFPSANCNLNVVAENAVGESPILHIVQLSGEVDV
jgi:hypothetical protein